MRRTLVVAVVGTAALALAGAGMLPADAGNSGPPVRSTSSTHDKDKLRETALAAGIQVAPKHRTLSQVKVHGKLVNQANPYLGMVRNPAKVDFSYWGRQADRQSAKRQPQSKVPVPTPFLYDEQEPVGIFGGNDSQANAERDQPVRPWGRQDARGANPRQLVTSGGRRHRRPGHGRGPGLDPARDRHRHPRRLGRRDRHERDRRRPARTAGDGMETSTSSR